MLLKQTLQDFKKVEDKCRRNINKHISEIDIHYQLLINALQEQKQSQLCLKL